jgi:hypothetical protein
VLSFGGKGGGKYLGPQLRVAQQHKTAGRTGTTPTIPDLKATPCASVYRKLEAHSFRAVQTGLLTAPQVLARGSTYA